MSAAAQTHNLKTIQWSVNVKIWDDDLFYELHSKGIFVTYAFVKISYLLNTYYIWISYYHKVISKNRYDFNAYNNIIDILYNTDVINSIVNCS